MKAPTIVTALLLIASSAFAASQAIQIEASYKGFDRSLLSPWLERGEKELHSPTVTVNDGQCAPIVMIKEIPVQISDTQKKIIKSGITFEVTPTVKDGTINVFGKSTICRIIEPKAPQPLSAKSFLTRETYFHGTVENGNPIIIRTGDADSDKGQITLTFTLMGPDGKPQEAEQGAAANP